MLKQNSGLCTLFWPSDHPIKKFPPWIVLNGLSVSVPPTGRPDSCGPPPFIPIPHATTEKIPHGSITASHSVALPIDPHHADGALSTAPPSPSTLSNETLAVVHSSFMPAPARPTPSCIAWFGGELSSTASRGPSVAAADRIRQQI